jgi:hypothetical protein
MFSYPMITQVLGLSKMTCYCSNPRKKYGAAAVKYGSQSKNAPTKSLFWQFAVL